MGLSQTGSCGLNQYFSSFYECGFVVFRFPVLHFKQVCLIPCMFIIVAVNSDTFLNFCIKNWAGEVEERAGGGETIITSQRFKAVSYSLFLSLVY